jgi:hypothetical protein
VAEVLGHLVERAALVEEQRGAGVAEVVAAEIGHASALEGRDPDAPPPVLPAQVAALAVGEDERARVPWSAGEVELDELAGDRLEEVGLAAALRFRRRDLVAGDRALDAQPLARAAAVVHDVAPDERISLRRPQAFVGEDGDQGGVLRVELSTDCLDRLGRAGVDRLGATVGDTAHANNGIPRETPPLDRTVEDALQHSQCTVDRRGAGAVDADSRGVVVDRLAGDLAQTLAAEVGNDPLVEQGRVGRERVRAKVSRGVRVPPFDEELLERRIRADHLRGELAELTRSPDRRFEELGVAPAVEGALAPRAPSSALVPADNVDGLAVATPTPLDAHLGSTGAAPRMRRRRRGCARPRRPSRASVLMLGA